MQSNALCRHAIVVLWIACAALWPTGCESAEERAGSLTADVNQDSALDADSGAGRIDTRQPSQASGRVDASQGGGRVDTIAEDEGTPSSADVGSPEERTETEVEEALGDDDSVRVPPQSDDADVDLMVDDSAVDADVPEPAPSEPSPDSDGPEPEEVEEDAAFVPAEFDGPFGGERPAEVFLPPDYDPESSWPMIMLLHGYLEVSEWQSVYYDLERFAAEKGVIYILPEGEKNLVGLPQWNATFGMCSPLGTDDVGYLVGLIEEAQQRFHIDDRRIFLMGHSCGGYMSYRLACERADLIAGFVNHAGGSVAFPESCNPSEPVTMVHAHGTFDPVVNYYLPIVGQNVASIGDWWAAHNGCTSGPEDLALRDYDKLVWFSETRPVAWDDCDDNAAVRIWRMNGSGHFPALQDRFTEDALDLLLAHPKPSD